MAGYFEILAREVYVLPQATNCRISKERERAIKTVSDWYELYSADIQYSVTGEAKYMARNRKEGRKEDAISSDYVICTLALLSALDRSNPLQIVETRQY